MIVVSQLYSEEKDLIIIIFFWPHLWHVDVPGPGTASATAVTYATSVAMPDPFTHCAGMGIEPGPPQQPKPLQLDS